MSMESNVLYYGDCLDWMCKWPADSVDLIYLDPPFNSNQDYSVFFSHDAPEERAQFEAFTDTWHWDEKAVDRYNAIAGAVAHPAHACVTGLHTIIGGCGMLAYLTYMAQRLAEMKRLLKNTGSIYLHCDPTASHYLKILMDGVFGAKRFRNEIVWCYTGPGSPGMRQFSRKHDIILWYSSGERWAFNSDAVRIPHKQLNTNKKGAVISEALSAEIRDAYLKKGKVPETWWPEFSPVGRIAGERLGYPTQKPIALLRRIIKASSHKGDVVLDPFCGCGTTIAAARELGREWIGVDISSFAVNLIKNRRLKDQKIKTEGIPADLVAAGRMAREKPLQFETWAVELLSGFAPNNKQTGDRGIDGRGVIATQDKDEQPKSAVVQVKGGRFNLGQMRDFAHVIQRERAALGVYVTLNKVTAKTAKAEARESGHVAIGQKNYPVLQLWSIEEHFDGRAPQLPVMLDPYTGKPDVQVEFAL